MESPQLAESVNRKKSLHDGAMRFVDEIISANLIIPQTYGAIRVMSARSLLRETATPEDFSPAEIFEEISEHIDTIVNDMVKKMHSAHAASEVEISSVDTGDSEAVRNRVQALLGYHFKIALPVTAITLDFCHSYFEDKDVTRTQIKAIQCIDVIYNTLHDVQLREPLRVYRQNMVANRENKEDLARELTKTWKELFLAKLHESDLLIAKKGVEPFVKFFDTVTDPSSLLLEDEVQMLDDE